MQARWADSILVDDDDLHILRSGHWYVCEKGHQRYVHDAYTGDPFHREIMRRAGHDIDGYKIDHINGNGLDNRKCNLRVCTDAENLRNQGIRDVPKTSRFKGVSQSKNHNRWRACIWLNYKRVHLGYFDTQEAAASAYDDAALQLHGEFARTNAQLTR